MITRTLRWCKCPVWLVLALCGFAGWHTRAETLIRELVSREYAIQVGGVQTPEVKELVSREYSVFVLTGPLDPYHEVVSREFSLVNTPAEPPPAVTNLLLKVSPAGDTVALDWSAYNQWAVGDIVRFDVYLADRAFTGVTGLTPYRSLPGETTGVALTGLPQFQDHFLAVVAVDGLGNFIPSVRYFGAYVISPEVISREVSLFNGAEPEPPYREVVSRELSLVVNTPQPPPAIVGIKATNSPAGDTVGLDWSAYNQWAVGDVVRYDIYRSDKPFASVAGMTPYASRPGETLGAILQGLPTGQDHFIAVVPVDGLGNFDPTVTYKGVYVLVGEITSREVSLFVGSEPEPPLREVVSREYSIVVPDDTVPAPVTGVGSGFSAVTSLLRPRALRVDWSAYNEVGQRDVVRYRVYLGLEFFDDVTGRDPQLLVPAEQSTVELNNLASATIYYVAVVAEDSQGNFNPIVRSVSAITTPKLEMAIPDQSVDEQTPLVYQLNVTEKDLTGYALRFGLVSGPPGLAVAANGKLSWLPAEADGPGQYPVVVSVTDNGVPPVTALAEFTVTVREVNVPPVLAAVPDQVVNALATLSLTLTASDADVPAQPLAFELLSGPTGLTVGTNGDVKWTPTAAQSPSTNAVSVRVSDGIADTATSFNVVVLPLPEPVQLFINYEGEVLTLRWKSSSLPYHLETSDALGSLWAPEGTTPISDGNDLLVRITPQNRQAYYRLVL